MHPTLSTHSTASAPYTAALSFSPALNISRTIFREIAVISTLHFLQLTLTESWWYLCRPSLALPPQQIKVQGTAFLPFVEMLNHRSLGWKDLCRGYPAQTSHLKWDYTTTGSSRFFLQRPGKIQGQKVHPSALLGNVLQCCITFLEKFSSSLIWMSLATVCGLVMSSATTTTTLALSSS